MSNEQVTRVTLFKIPEPEAQEKLLGLYKELQNKALKDGKPYIINCKAGYTEDDPRNQGFDMVAQTVFASRSDFEYYDKQCSAHAALRDYAKSVNKGSMMVYFHSAI